MTADGERNEYSGSSAVRRRRLLATAGTAAALGPIGCIDDDGASGLLDDGTVLMLDGIRKGKDPYDVVGTMELRDEER